MKLSLEQRAAVRREYGICANEACDKCGKLLAAVRYTHRGELGEWCSKICRDGTAAVETREARRAGRPRLKLSPNARIAHRRAQIREAVQRCRSVIKNVPQPTESMGVADAILPSLDVRIKTAQCNQKFPAMPVLEALR